MPSKNESTNKLVELSPNDVFIAVMALTGSGKSSFVKLCTQLDVPIGGSLHSCNTAVCVYSFEYKGRKVHLIDTPGLNDSQRSESDVLQEICFWLSSAYGLPPSQRLLLSGVIYLHPLTEQRWTATSQRSIDFLKALCGRDNYPCIRLVSTFWDQTTLERGALHERQLICVPGRWGDIVDSTLRESVFRHDSTYQSALRIVDSIVQDNVKVVLRVQKELSQPGTALLDTAVGRLAQIMWDEDIVNFQEKIQERNMSLQRRHSPDCESELASLRANVSKRENSIASLTVDRQSLNYRWKARYDQDDKRLNEQLEQCKANINTLEQRVERQECSPLNIAIYHNDFASVGESSYEQRLKQERQRRKDLMALRMARMTNRSMHAAIAGTLIGGLGVGLAALPFAMAACVVM